MKVKKGGKNVSVHCTRGMVRTAKKPRIQFAKIRACPTKCVAPFHIALHFLTSTQTHPTTNWSWPQDQHTLTQAWIQTLHHLPRHGFTSLHTSLPPRCCGTEACQRPLNSFSCLVSVRLETFNPLTPAGEIQVEQKTLSWTMAPFEKYVKTSDFPRIS
jgi:hypothetical protein